MADTDETSGTHECDEKLIVWEPDVKRQFKDLGTKSKILK